MAAMPPDSVDAIVTDPPYELNFGGEAWDRSGVAFDAKTWRTALDVLKPGGHLVSFGAPRTYHRLACAIEDAGFEIRGQLQWLYGNGMPKSKLSGPHEGLAGNLKPAHEPIVLARKPCSGSMTENIEAYGTGALRVGDCKIGERFPADVMFDDAAAELLDKQTGVRRSGSRKAGIYRGMGYEGAADREYPAIEGDEGGASRFFYCSKASKKERSLGLPEGTSNDHLTVKPLDLMRWLCRLVTPPGGVILDPFAGSGTTGCAAVREGLRFHGIELSKEHASIARLRIEHCVGNREQDA